MRSRAFGPMNRRLAAGLLTLLASALVAPPAGAQEEDGGGWLDAIVDLLKPSEGAPVDVPLRKTDRPPEPEPPPAQPEAPAEASSTLPEAPAAAAPPPPEEDAEAPGEPSVAEASPPPEDEAGVPGEEPPPPEEDAGAPDAAPVAEAPPVPGEEAEAPGEPSVAQASPPPPLEMPARVEGATLGDVHRAVHGLVADIRILREASGADDAPREAGPVEGREPVHLYVKTLEVWTKVAQAQRRLDVPAGEVGRAPPRAVDAADVLVNVEHLRNELARVKARLGIARTAEPAPLEPAVTPSDVYHGLAEASLLLDALRGGPLGPDELYRHAAAVLDEAALIAAALGTSAAAAPPPAPGAKQPGDVAQLLLRAAYKIVNLQIRLRMDASPVPATPLDRSSPSQSYDALTVLLAELVRIKHHLAIDEAPGARPEAPEGQRWDDVFALAQRLVATFDRLSAAAVD